MKDECNNSNDTLVKIFKIEVPSDYQNKYIEFLKQTNDYLKGNYGKYFICYIILQDKEDCKVFYTVELYNDTPGIESTYNKLSKEVKTRYEKEFGDKIKRTLVEDISEIKKIYPS